MSTWLVHVTQNPLAPAYYLTAVSLIGFITILVLFETTSGKALKGSYPTVSNEKEFNHVVKNAEEALWWKEQELQIKEK